MSTTLGDYLNKSQVNKYQQAFLAPLPGKVARQKGNIDKLILINVIEITIDLCSNMLIFVLSIFVSYAGQCMTSFDVATN